MTNANGANILASKAVLSSVSISCWTAQRFDKKVTREVAAQHNARRDVGRYNKQLVGKEALTELTAIATSARQFHYTHTQPWLDAENARILPSALYLDYANTMREFRERYGKAADTFCNAYPDIVEGEKERLNGLWDSNDYPSPNRIRSLFSFDTVIMPLPDTADFRIALTGTDVDTIRRDIESRMQSAMANGIRDTAERIVERVGHMAERLRAYKPAQSKGDKVENMFRDSLVENVRDLAGLLPAFNLSDDPRMAEVISRIQSDLTIHEAEDLRTDESLRHNVAAEAESILASVSEFLA